MLILLPEDTNIPPFYRPNFFQYNPLQFYKLSTFARLAITDQYSALSPGSSLRTLRPGIAQNFLPSLFSSPSAKLKKHHINLKLKSFQSLPILLIDINLPPKSFQIHSFSSKYRQETALSSAFDPHDKIQIIAKLV